MRNCVQHLCGSLRIWMEHTGSVRGMLSDFPNELWYSIPVAIAARLVQRQDVVGCLCLLALQVRRSAWLLSDTSTGLPTLIFGSAGRGDTAEPYQPVSQDHRSGAALLHCDREQKRRLCGRWRGVVELRRDSEAFGGRLRIVGQVRQDTPGRHVKGPRGVLPRRGEDL